VTDSGVRSSITTNDSASSVSLQGKGSVQINGNHSPSLGAADVPTNGAADDHESVTDALDK